MEGWSRRSLLHSEIQPGPWTLIAGSIIIVAVCYANSVPNDFILDDYHIVAVNPAIRSIAPLEFLTTPYWGEKGDHGIFRPLTIFSFSLEYPLWRRWPGGYRLTNLLLHAINGVLIFLLAKAIFQSAPAAAAASALYLAHPVHTEPVVGLAGRGELLAAMFFLLAWILFRQGRVMSCAVAFFLSLLSKENAIAFPAVMLLDRLISRKKAQKGGMGEMGSDPRWQRDSCLRSRYCSERDQTPFLPFPHFVPLCGSALLYLGLRFWVLGSLGIPKTAQYLDGTMTFAERELTSGRAFLKYFQLLIAPVNVTGDYDFNSIPVGSLNDWIAWTGLLLVAGSIAFAFRILKKQPALGFAILFFFVTMFPSSNWLMPTSIVMSERALYLPSLGICLIAGLLWARIRSREIRGIVGAGVLTIAALLCIAHNYVWRNELSYYRNMVQVLPNNVRGRQGYGIALTEAGLAPAAREQFEAGLQIRRNAPLLVGLGSALMQIDGGCGRARPVLREALTVQPADPFAPWLLGNCYEKEGLIQEAEANYRQAVHNTPFPDPRLLDTWGRTLERIGRPGEAQEAYRRAGLLK